MGESRKKTFVGTGPSLKLGADSHSMLTVYVVVMPPDATLMVTVLIPLYRDVTVWVMPQPPLTLTVTVPAGVTFKALAVEMVAR